MQTYIFLSFNIVLKAVFLVSVCVNVYVCVCGGGGEWVCVSKYLTTSWPDHTNLNKLDIPDFLLTFKLELDFSSKLRHSGSLTQVID